MFHVVVSSDSLSLPRPWLQGRPQEYPELFTRFEHTYPYLLEQRLKASVDPEARVSNFGTRGSTLASAYSHRLELFSWMHADVGVVHRGIVDCWPRVREEGQPMTPLAQFEEVWTGLLEARQQENPRANLIVIGISPATGAILKKYPTVNEVIAGYNNVLKSQLGARTRYLDMTRLVALHGGAIHHPDGQHLSRFGHQLVAEELQRLIAAMPPSARVAAKRPTGPTLTRVVSSRAQSLRQYGTRAQWRFLDEMREVVVTDPELTQRYATLAHSLGEIDAMAAVLDAAPPGLEPLREACLRANLLTAQNRPAEAVALLDKAQVDHADQLTDDAPEVGRSEFWRSRLEAYLALDDAEAAIDAARRWSAARSDAFVPIRMLARAFLKAERLDLARQFYAEAIALDDQPQLRIELAEIQVRQGLAHEALATVAGMAGSTPAERRRLEQLRQQTGGVPAL